MLVGFMLGLTWYITNVAIGKAIILAQLNFDFIALRNFDISNLHNSYKNNYLYQVVIAALQAIWYTLNISIFASAYFRYKGVK